jgi:hypothetical protein
MNSLAKDFFTTFLAGFIFLLVLFTNPAFAYIIEENESSTSLYFADPVINDPNPTQLGSGSNTGTGMGTGTSTGTGTNTNTNTSTPKPDSSGIPKVSDSPADKAATSSTQTCAVSKLTPTEAKGIMDLTSQGFIGEKMNTGDTNADTNTKGDVKELKDASLVGKELGGDRAVKVDPPKYAAPADRFSFFNNQAITGPFGIGLIMSDTLRVGRCADLPQEQCRVFGDGLYMRTGGTGIKTDLVNAFDSISSDSTKSAGTVASQNLSAEEYEKMKANYLDFNTGEKTFTTGSFSSMGEKVMNSIYTQNYSAKNATTCNNSACTISTYSAFDKYFNAWLSTDMVVFNVGPTVLHKANKLLERAYRLSTKEGKPLANPLGIFEKFRNKTVTTLTPRSLMGQRFDRYNAIIKEEGFDAIFEPLTIKAKLFSSGAGGETGKILDPSSPIWKFTPEKRRKFFEAVEQLRGYARTNTEFVDAATQAYKASARTPADKLEYAKKVTDYIVEWDDAVQLDTPAWMKINDDLFSLNGLALRKNGPYPDGQGYIDISTAAPFNFKRALQQFQRDGSWAAWSGSSNAETFTALADGKLKLYKIDVSEVLANNATLNDLKGHIVKYGQGGVSVRLADGRVMSLTNESYDYIAGLPGAAGTLTVYKSGYVPTTPLSPEDFANRVTDSRMVGRPNTALRNLDELHNALVQNDFAGRRSYSWLDQQFANEGDMLRAYYRNPTVGVYKGLVLPIAYWEAKKGLGNADYSAYMLPETWTALTINPGVDNLYRDSYTDFYANEGSDQGDMFKRAFNSLPFVWNSIVKMGASTNQFTSDMLNKVTFGFLNDDGMVSGGMRDTVKDVAFYSHNENCADCVANLSTVDSTYFGLGGFTAKVGMQAFMLEAADDETKTTSGTTLISYSHHTNLKGKSGQVDGDEINLVDAQRESNTCDQKLRKLGLGFFGTASGGALGLVENAAYFAGFGYGLIASLVQQMYYARELQDCVDDKEGYYIHFYAPPAKDSAKAKSKEILSNETVSSALSDMSTKIDSVVKEKTASSGTEKPVSEMNPVEQSMDKIKSQFNEFASKATQKNVLQASLEMAPPSSGNVLGKDIFYVWFKEKMTPVGYRTTGKVTTTDGNMSVVEDYEKGTLTINGKQVLGPDKADHVRMIATVPEGPFKSVPVTLNKVAAPNDDSVVFQLNTYGELKVLNQQVLDCIQKAVVDQTGITYTGDELTQVFGNLGSIKTETYGAVIVNKTSGEIVLEGSGPRLKGTGTAKFIINGRWDTRLEIDANQKADGGKFVGMEFENGSIVLKPATNELIIWLRQHAQSILTSKEVKGLNAKLATVKDPESGCDQPAIDLEAVPQSGDELGAKKVSNFNTSMDHLGPFTQFTTDKRIYEFYSKRDEETGECKNYFRVRDKDTGKVLTDSEIVGGITQSPDGTISFKTADGKEHSLKFDAENGVPKVSYNGGAPETLLSAQGPNGSFWYDPNKGLWYPENGLQIPLSQAFKDNGAYFGTDANGNVTGTPVNPMTFNLGQQGSSGFNIPSMPETASGIVLFASAFLLVAFVLTRRRRTVNF